MEQSVTIPVGYCHCGCGQQTNLKLRTDRSKGYEKGQPYKFVSQHHARLMVKEKNPSWKGGRSIDKNGYVLLTKPEHPRAHPTKGYVLEHILIAEKALGKYLPLGAEVHHVNKIRSDNRNNNLVICDHNYHMVLHMRQRALEACGNPNWLKCRFCKQWDAPHNFCLYPSGQRCHLGCNNHSVHKNKIGAKVGRGNNPENQKKKNEPCP